MAAVLVAPDSFKGTFSAVQVAEAIGRGLRAEGHHADLCPAADGGEGTMEALAAAFGATRVSAIVSDPLGRPVDATFALHREVAIVEAAEASGLHRVAVDERDAVAASSAGTGELIAAAVIAGARNVYVGVGGSATTDGGAGAVNAIRSAGGLRNARLVVLCDVRTTFEDAAEVFAAQKGATPAQIKQLTARLHLRAHDYPRDPRGVPMTGAAGGLSGGLWAALGAELVPGADFVLSAVGFDQRLSGASLVVTGEGKLDLQSLQGKLVSEITARARAHGVPTCAVVGSTSLDQDDASAMGLTEITVASTLGQIEAAGRQLAKLDLLSTPSDASFG